mmetsp:Transcript_2358/g.9129  ORF Transcript_2358/g.9129 Transcript_2358/m.9129 type:complete len:204 (+) Transcript_2358:450-1061(+)
MISTKAPKGWTDLTSPSNAVPLLMALTFSAFSLASACCAFLAANLASRSASLALIASSSSAVGGGFMVREMRPFSASMDLTQTVTAWSAETTSVTFSTNPSLSSEMCTRPSFLAPKSTKQPYSCTRFTLPSYLLPTAMSASCTVTFFLTNLRLGFSGLASASATARATTARRATTFWDLAEPKRVCATGAMEAMADIVADISM